MNATIEDQDHDDAGDDHRLCEQCKCVLDPDEPSVCDDCFYEEDESDEDDDWEDDLDDWDDEEDEDEDDWEDDQNDWDDDDDE